MKEAQLEIDTKSLRENYLWFSSQTSSDFVCPMVKANAYGVGDIYVIPELIAEGADWLGVVRLSEALRVRKLHTKVNILIFSPLGEVDYLKTLEKSITPVISNLKALKDLASACKRTDLKEEINIHLELGTGMNRLGFKPAEIATFMTHLKNLRDSGLKIRIDGFFTHFLLASDWPNESGRSRQQLEMFEETIREIETYKREHPSIFSEEISFHISSSRALSFANASMGGKSGVMKYGIRPGIDLYGISPLNTWLKPVISLKAPIIDLKWIEAGESVSYDATWIAKRKSLIGVLPIGYGDGLPRSLSNLGSVIVANCFCPIVGLICMDFVMIDLTEMADTVKEEDVALIFGKTSEKSISVQELADKAGLSAYELMTGFSKRLKRLKVEV